MVRATAQGVVPLRALAALLLLTPAFVGCLGASDDSLDSSAADASGEVPALPEGLVMDGADVVSSNETSVTWRWEGVAPTDTWRAGSGPPDSVTTRFAIPADVVVHVSAELEWSDPAMDLNLYVADEAGSYRCTSEKGGWITGGDGTESCDVTVRDPAPEGERWTVRVASFHVPPGGTPFSVELTVSLLPDVRPVGRAVGLPPGCDSARPATVHHGEETIDPQDGAATGVACMVRLATTTFEPSLGVASDGTWFFAPSYTGWGWGVARSTDEGATWQHIRPSLAGATPHVETNDPFLHVDPDTDRVFLDNLHPYESCATLSWSDDGGSSWGHSVSGCTVDDHQKIATGPPTVSTTVDYPSVVYRCAYAYGWFYSPAGHASVGCQRSLDGGRTWLAPGAPAFEPDPIPGGRPGIGEVATDDDGRLYLAAAASGSPLLAVSEDEGLTWRSGPVAEATVAEGDNDAAVTVDAGGNVYVAWAGNDGRVHLVASQDHGGTWSGPLDITMPGVVEVTAVHLAGGAPGQVAVSYLGTEAPPDTDPDMRPWNGYIGVTADAVNEAPTFRSVAINPTSEPLTRGECGPGRCVGVGDFIDVEIDRDGTAIASFADPCTGPCSTGEAPRPDEPFGEGVVGRLWVGSNLLDGEGERP